MTWLVSAVSLLATWLNIRRRRVCFALWFGTNVTWAAVDFGAGLPAQGCLMSVYAALAVWGWVSWR